MTLNVVLLAAGFGTRMYPLTEQTAKPLLKVGGQPVLTRLVGRVNELPDVGQITVTTNQRFHADMQAWAAAQQIALPIKVINSGATEPANRRGAVGDLAAAMEIDHSGARWLVMAGDNLLDHPLALYVDAVADGNAVLCRDLGDHVPSGMFGEVTVDDTGTVTGFREKPDDPQSPLAATCTYLLDGHAPERVGQYLDNGGNPDAPGQFISWLSEQVPVQALSIRGDYFDIGSLEALEVARVAYS